jgi:hypothetical protein
VLDLRSDSGQPSRPQASDIGGEPQPTVLLVSRAADQDADRVTRLLEATGTPVTRLDAETAEMAGLIVDLDRRAVLVDGRWIRPTVTWLRHFSHRAMAAEPEALRQAFAADSWQALADQLAVVSAATIGCREPGMLAQLAAAAACGLATPRTVVTTEPARAAPLLDRPKLVVKALHRHFVEASPGLLTGVFPVIAERGALASIPPGPPVAVQEHVDHDTEIRLYYVHGQVAAAFTIVKSGPAQEWHDPELVTAQWVEPPPALAASATALAEALSIEYGAFDFLISGGVPVFLEVNIAGDWRWLESKVGAEPVTIAVVRMLRAMHRRSLVNESMPISRASTVVNPVTFLSCGISRTPVDKEERSL